VYITNPDGTRRYVDDEVYLRNQNRSSVNPAVNAGINIAAKEGLSALAGGSSSAVPVGSHISGGVMMSDGSVAAAPAGASPFLGAAGAYGLYDLFANDRGGVRGPLQGAASGAAIGSAFPVIGTGVGAAVGGLLGLGQSIFGGKSKTKIEEDRRKALAEQGINLGDTKGWELNETFKKSRKESDLTGKDITQAASLYGIFGDRWKNASEENRIKVADEALKRGLIREHHGTIDLTTQPQDFMDFAGTTLSSIAPQAPSGPARKKPTQRKEKPEFTPDPNLPLDAITPKYNAPAPQAEPDNFDYNSMFNEFMKRKQYAR